MRGRLTAIGTVVRALYASHPFGIETLTTLNSGNLPSGLGPLFVRMLCDLLSRALEVALMPN